MDETLTLTEWGLIVEALQVQGYDDLASALILDVEQYFEVNKVNSAAYFEAWIREHNIDW